MRYRVVDVTRGNWFQHCALWVAVPLLVGARVANCQALAVAPVTAIQPPAAEINRAVEAGLTLEQAGNWSEALGHYEEALHEYPEQPALLQRFDICRVHHSVERRYSDSSYLAALQSLRPEQAEALLDDLLRKIDSHYVSTPPWTHLAQRGGYSIDVALRNEPFRTSNGVRAGGDQIVAAGRDLRASIAQRGEIRTRPEMIAATTAAAQIAEQRIGLSRSAALLEFVAAAAEGLDHYSSFLTPDQLRDVYSQIEGNFVGLGVELKADEGDLLVVRTIPGSPAQRNGIIPGDRIVAVDGQATADLSTDEAASLLTGVEGSMVQVAVIPAAADRSSQPRLMTVRREHVEVPSIEDVKIVRPQHGIAYVRVPVFQKTTSRDLENALWNLHRQGMQSLVVDLRGNPGGLLTAAVELADKFVSRGGIVSTRGRSPGEDFDYQAQAPGTWRVPLVVLIDGDSASASEIFAAAIRDNRRGTIVGERSFGKGSVQGIFPLGHAGSGVRLTTAKFFSPLGNPISGIGVSPDPGMVIANPVAEPGRQTVGFRGAQGSDPQLEAAINQAIEVARRPIASVETNGGNR